MPAFVSENDNKEDVASENTTTDEKNLRWMDLQHADLQYADLQARRTCLADLQHADLRKATLNGRFLARTKPIVCDRERGEPEMAAYASDEPGQCGPARGMAA